MSHPDSPRVPLNSLVFGFGPMLPLVAAGAGAWVLRWPASLLSVQAAILWGAVILVFIAGVRRGFGFGRPSASTPVEIATMLVYFLLALAALLVPDPVIGLVLLMVGFLLAALLDRRAAIAGDAPRHFARLRPPQMLLGTAGMALALARLLV